MTHSIFHRIVLMTLLPLVAGTALAAAPELQGDTPMVWAHQLQADRDQDVQFRASSTELSDALTKLSAARHKRTARLTYLARMEGSLASVRETAQAEFPAGLPEKDELARLIHAQVLKVAGLKPVVAPTPEGLARDSRIRELILVLRDQQAQSAKEFQAARSGAAPAEAEALLVKKMKTEFQAGNSELLTLQAAKRDEFEKLATASPFYQLEKARLDRLISVGELQDRQTLMASAQVALAADTQAVYSLEATVNKLALDCIHGAHL